MVDEFWRLQRERVAAPSCEGAQAYMTGNFPLTIETPSQIALQVLNALFYGLDLKDLETFRERVDAVTPDDIQRVAKATSSRTACRSCSSATPRRSCAAESAGFANYERMAIDPLDLDQADRRAGRRRPARCGSSAPSPLASASPAAGLPAARRRRGRELVDQAIAAKGGLDALRAVRTVKAAANTTMSTPQGPIRSRRRPTSRTPTGSASRPSCRPAGSCRSTMPAGRGCATPRRAEAPPGSATIRGQRAARLVPLLLRIHDGQAEVRAVADVAGEDGRTRPAVEVSGAGGDPHAVLRPGDGAGRGPTLPDVRPGRRARRLEERYSDYRAVSGVQSRSPPSSPTGDDIERDVHTLE